jgi:hypothetical protein
MSFSRYTFSTRKKDLNNEQYISNSKSSYRIYRAVQSGAINCNVKTLEEGERLDTIAGSTYNNSSLWWVIAAASGIGWGLQVPPGTIIKIPINLSQVFGVIS